MTVAAGGLSAQFGMVDEVTFNTSITVTRFLEFNSETLDNQVARIESGGMRVGRKVLRSGQWLAGKKNVTGDVEFEVQQQGFGLLLKHMLGSVSSAQPAVGTDPTVWEHTFTVGQLDGKSFTCQVGLGDATGNQRAKTYSGCKVAKWDLSAAIDGFLMLKPTIDGASEATATAMAAATYPASTKPLAFTGATITLPSGVTGNVSKFDLTGDNKQNLARYFMSGSGSGMKKEQLEEGLRAYAGTLDVEFDDLTAYNQYVNGTLGSMTAFFEGDIISHAYQYALEVTMPAVRFDGKTPNVSGMTIPTISAPFVCLDDGAGTGGLKMVYRTTDTAP